MLNSFNTVVLQPITQCNLNCGYCYLPSRQEKFRMSVETCLPIVKAIEGQGKKVGVIWHGGEPLLAGLDYFCKLIEPFRHLADQGLVKHYIQTNATLINQKWCDFFIREKIEIGISIDGTEAQTAKRVDWGDRPAHQRIMRGVKFLQANQIPFYAIAVVTNQNLHGAEELLSFFESLGCYSLGLNIEEIEGDNHARDVEETLVGSFWTELFRLWKNKSTFRIREFSEVLSYVEAVANDLEESWEGYEIHAFPTVAWNGDTYLLSPEFAGQKSPKYDDFVVGNVLLEPLEAIIQRGASSAYVIDFEAGKKDCMSSCEYFGFCGGGQASNKFFEHGTTRATETAFCRMGKKTLFEAVFSQINE